MQMVEHRKKVVGLPDLLLYDALIDDGVLLLQDGALLAGWSFRGPDMASATPGEMASEAIPQLARSMVHLPLRRIMRYAQARRRAASPADAKIRPT